MNSSQKKLNLNSEFVAVNSQYKKIKETFDDIKRRIVQVSDMQKSKQKTSELDHELIAKILKHEINCTHSKQGHQLQLNDVKHRANLTLKAILDQKDKIEL